MEEVKASVDHDPFHLSGVVVFGDTYGDPEVPGGVGECDPYVDDLSVMIGEENIVDYIADIFQAAFCSLLVEAARDE